MVNNYKGVKTTMAGPESGKMLFSRRQAELRVTNAENVRWKKRLQLKRQPETRMQILIVSSCLGVGC